MKIQIPATLLLVKHTKKTRKGLNQMFNLAVDACGSMHPMDSKSVKKELLETKKALLQMLALVEVKP